MKKLSVKEVEGWKVTLKKEWLDGGFLNAMAPSSFKKLIKFTEELLAQAREETLKILDQAELEKWFDMPDTLDNWKTWKRIRNTIADSLASAKGEHDKK